MNDELSNLDRTMTALAHPTRRAILRRVMRHESRVTDLAAPFAMSLNAVSKHIRVLEEARLVTRRRVWREHFVSFNPEPLNEVAQWIEQARAYWNERFDALDAMLREEVRSGSPDEKTPPNPPAEPRTPAPHDARRRAETHRSPKTKRTRRRG
ncbi:MAG: metalloregulator ArsR/SmtB family transcription factor [Phycisphaerales bacterium]|nr:metalloregulator ArsR/SmtB family transcription factor [Phycisphaerales bacterium]